MHLSARSYLTAGVAALSAGAIALTPIQPTPDNLALAPQRTVESLAVSLAAAIDPITAWKETIQLSAANVQKMIEFYLEQPIPLIQTISANIGTYIKALPDFQFIGQSIANNVQIFFKAPWDPGTSIASPGPCATDPCSDPTFYNGDYISNVPITNRVPLLGKLSQRGLYQLLPSVLQASDPDLLTKLAPLLAFAATHYSGEIAGLLGMFASPLVQLTRSFSAIGADVQAGDVTGAINELINIPANVTNALLNGAGYLDLTAVVNNIAPLPPEIKTIGINLGGVISPPVPYEGTLDAPTAVSGGVLFDGIATEATALGLSVTSPGLPVGWYNSVIGLGQFLGRRMLVTPPLESQARVAKATSRRATMTARVAAAAPAMGQAESAAEAPTAAVKATTTKRAKAATRATARGAKSTAASHRGR